jgi:hypothetical protein
MWSSGLYCVWSGRLFTFRSHNLLPSSGLTWWVCDFLCTEVAAMVFINRTGRRNNTRIKEQLGSNLSLVTLYTDWGFAWFHSDLEAHSGIAPILGHERFLPNLFQFICRSTIRRLRYIHTISVVKQPTKRRSLRRSGQQEVWKKTRSSGKN